ncbi:hypothetical protein Trydic_g21143 [Trypoxylus dichotomus]
MTNQRKEDQDKADESRLCGSCTACHQQMKTISSVFERDSDLLKGKSWQDDFVKSIRKPKSYDSKPSMIFHAGTENWFIGDASLIFASNNKAADYNASMTSTTFKQLLTAQLFPNIPYKSLITMDNASHIHKLFNRFKKTRTAGFG